MTTTTRSALAGVLTLALAGCGGSSTEPPPPAAVDAARSTLVAAPPEAIADGVAAVTITAMAKDAGGAPLAGRTAAFSVIEGVAQLSAASAMTGADGTTSVTLTSTLAGPKSVSALIDGVDVKAHATATFVAGPPAAVSFTVQPSDTTAGVTFGVGLTVADVHGNAVAGASVSLALEGGPDGAALSGTTTATTSADGSAGLSGLSITKAGAGYALVATTGAAQGTSSTFAVGQGSPSLAGSQLVASPATVTAGGAGSIVTVTIVDAWGNAVPGAVVTLDSSVAGDTVGAPGAAGLDGVATGSLAGTAAGPRTLTASVGGLPLVQTATVTVLPAAPDAAASSAAGPAGTVVADGSAAAVGATIRDAYGNPVPGVAVSVATSGGTLSSGSATTGADGSASVTVSSTVAGTVTVTLSFGGGSLDVPVTFVAAPAAALVLSGLPGSTTAGSAASATVTARDAYGNVASGYRGTVRFGSSDATAVLPADYTFTGIDAGTHTFPGSIALRTAGTQNISVHDIVAGALSTTGPSIQVAPGAAASLAFIVQPTGAVAGAVLTPAIEVAVRDAFGNTVTAPQTVSLALPAGTLTGTTSAASVGTVTFAGLAVTTAGTGLHLVASSAGLPDATSAAFDVAPGAPDAVASDVAASAGTPTAGDEVTLTATVRDAYGNAVPDITVTFAATGTDNTLSGAATTSTNGVATGTLSSTKAEAKTVTAKAGALALSAQPVVTFEPGAADASGSTLAASPTSAPDDGTSISLTATVGDRYGNPVEGATVTFSSSGTATFVPPTAGTGVDGKAAGSVSALAAGAQTISASVGGTRVAQTDVTFTAAPPSPSESTAVVSRASVSADGTTAAIATVTVKDGLGRAVPGATVALTFSRTALIAPPSAVTNGSGAAFFAVTSTQAGSGALTATVNAGPGQVVVAQQPALEFVTPSYTIGGVVFGLTGDGLVLSTAGQPDLTVPAGASSFVFGTRVASGTSYAVGVTQPPGLACKVLNGSGTVGGADVIGVLVDCTGQWKQVAAGAYHSLGIKTNGDLWAWGSNGNGQLGDGTWTQATTPKLIGSGFASVAAGSYHSLAVKTNGDLYAWGYNGKGQLGDGSTTQARAPELIGSGFAFVAAGNSHSLAVKTNGDLYAWGNNAYGQLGDGSATQANAPKLIGSGFASIAAGYYHSLAVKTNGDLYAWGYNNCGQLGDGTTTQANAPKLIGSGFASVAAGSFHSLAVKTNGDLYAWGYNGLGQLGDGTSTQTNAPKLIGPGFASVAAGSFHSLAIKASGDLYAWGNNAYGQLGDGTTTQASAPKLIGSGFATVATGSDSSHSLAIKTSGDLYAFGYDNYGQLGDDGAIMHVNAPELIGSGFSFVAAGSSHSLAIKTNGDLYAWGWNFLGQLGDGSTMQANAPKLIAVGFASVAAGYYHSLGIKTNGDLYAWGYNNYGQLGDGTTTRANAPKLIGSGFAYVAAGFAHSLAVKTNGDLYAWGYNVYGQLGDGSVTQANAPKLIGSGFAFVAAGSYHSLAVKTNGDLYAWGYNAYGQLGDGSTTQANAPKLIGSGFASIAAGSYHSLAIKANGDLYAWGSNGNGQLGGGFASVAAGANHSLALKTNGDLYAWGYNGSGQIGDGTTTQAYAPKLIGSGFASVAGGDSHSLAIRMDGDLYASGWNGSGQLGDGHDYMWAVPIIVGNPTSPAGLSYAPTVATYVIGVGIAPNVPTWTGAATFFTVSPALPAGLSLGAATGIVSGTPTMSSPTSSYEITASGPMGSTTGLLTITVN